MTIQKYEPHFQESENLEPTTDKSTPDEFMIFIACTIIGNLRTLLAQGGTSIHNYKTKLLSWVILSLLERRPRSLNWILN